MFCLICERIHSSKDSFLLEWIYIYIHNCFPGNKIQIEISKQTKQLQTTAFPKHWTEEKSRTLMARISLGQWQSSSDIGSSSHWGLNTTPNGANGDNLGVSLQSTIKYCFVDETILMGIRNIPCQD